MNCSPPLQPSGMITLTTDFGGQDAYVGVMKGVILGIAPRLTLVDLTHGIAPQDVWAARFQLLNSFAYFPRGTVHLAVVDPGVGGSRRAIALEFDGGWFVGPDNGMVSGILEQVALRQVVQLINRDYWRVAEPSATFHGRDIFAPVAAHLAQGTDLAKLGPRLKPDQLVSLALPPCQGNTGSVIGCIQHIDGFGNLISNIPNDRLAAWGAAWQAMVAEVSVLGRESYGAVAAGELLALRGSHGWVEIAVNQGSAQERLGIKLGDGVRVGWLDAMTR